MASRRAASTGPPGRERENKGESGGVGTIRWHEDVLRHWQTSLRPWPGEEEERSLSAAGQNCFSSVFSRIQATNAQGQGVAGSARADGVAAWGERKVARESKKKKDVGADTGGVVEDSSTRRLLSYEAFSLRDGHGAAREVGPSSATLAVAVVFQVANG